MNIATIGELSRARAYPEAMLRRRLKEGKLPGFFSGTRYYVDRDRLEEMLAAESAANAANAQQVSTGDAESRARRETT